MKIAQINMVVGGSTGNIMRQIATCARSHGHEAITYSSPSFSRSHPETFPQYEGHRYFGTPFNHAIHYVLGRLTGRNGCFSYFTTKKLVKELKEFSPDILHLHNLHNWCIHLPTLFRYIKENDIRVIWTLHDCWTFTGQCPHFDMIQCEKWKTGCHDCPQTNAYPESMVDATRRGYAFKKKWFCGVKNMTLVTPSHWLAELTKQSFMGQYPVTVIQNGIDLNIFQPTQSYFRETHGIRPDQFLLLGVAFDWGHRKGLDVFIELAKRLDDRFRLVLVGTNETVDTKLPDNIVSIHRTESQKELAEIYTAADIFINPTREDTLPTVNMEALACGTPVVTFRTGGSPEIINEKCGSIVAKNDIDALEREILRICAQRPYTKEACAERANHFDMCARFEEYVNLYHTVSK